MREKQSKGGHLGAAGTKESPSESEDGDSINPSWGLNERMEKDTTTLQRVTSKIAASCHRTVSHEDLEKVNNTTGSQEAWICWLNDQTVGTTGMVRKGPSFIESRRHSSQRGKLKMQKTVVLWLLWHLHCEKVRQGAAKMSMGPLLLIPQSWPTWVINCSTFSHKVLVWPLYLSH